MSVIKAEVDELKIIDMEIRRNLDNLKKLREKKNQLQMSIANFLNEKDIPGVKYNGDVVLIQRKDKTIRKSKKTQEQTVLNLLRENGVQNPEEVAKKLKTVGKEKIKIETIKIEKGE